MVVTLSLSKGISAQYVQPMRYPHYSFTDQVNIGVGTARTTNASAYLEVGPTSGANKGFLPPRLTTTQRNSISSPAAGLFIYNSTTGRYNFYNGIAWADISASSGVDSLWRTPGVDSIFWLKNGITYKIKDSTGGGATPTLQQAITAGDSLTTNNGVKLGENSLSFIAAVASNDEDAENYFSRVVQKGGTISYNARDSVTNLVKKLKSLGVWDDIDDLWLSNVTEGFTGSNVKLKYKSVDTVTYNSISSGDWSKSDGIALGVSNTTKYVNTNYNTSSLNCDNVQAGFYVTNVTNSGSGDKVISGVQNGSNALVVQYQDNTGAFANNVFSGNTSIYASATSDDYTENIWGVLSTSSTSLSAVQDYQIADVESGNRGSSSLPNYNIYIGTLNNAGTPTAYGNGNVKGYFIGDSISSANYYYTTRELLRFQRYAALDSGDWVFLSFDATENLRAYSGTLTSVSPVPVTAPYINASTTRSERDARTIKIDSFYYVTHSIVNYGNFYQPSTKVAIVKSRDMQVFELVDTVDVGGTASAITWSPDWFKNGNDYYIVFTQDSTGTGNYHKPFYIKVNPTTGDILTPRTQITGTAIQSNIIDVHVVVEGDTSYLFYKNESTIELYRAKSTSFFSGYDTTYLISEIPANTAEGISIIKSGSTFYMYYDKYVAGTGIHYRTSSNLRTWGSETRLNNSYVIRNGAFVQLDNLLFPNEQSFTNDTLLFMQADKVGIGTSDPDSTLHLVGGLKIVNGTQGAGKVLTSDANGGASWQNVTISRIDTITIASFGYGARLAGDTAAATDSSLYGSFYHDGSDTLIITGLRAVITSGDTLGVQVYYNDTINVIGSAVAASTLAVNSSTTGNSTTTFSNNKIPPGNWVWCKSPTVVAGRKPEYLSVSLIGYRKTRQ